MSPELSPTPLAPETKGSTDAEATKATRTIIINGLPGEAFSDKKTSWTGEIPVVAKPSAETASVDEPEEVSAEEEITPGFYLRSVEEAKARREEAEAAKGESLVVRTRRAIGSAATRLADLVRPYEGRHEMTRDEKKAARKAGAVEEDAAESLLKTTVNKELPGEALPFSETLTVESHFDMDKKAEKEFNGVKRGDSLSFGGHEWSVQFVDQDGVILRRESDEGVYEEQISFDELNEQGQDDNQETSISGVHTSRLKRAATKIGDIPRSAAAKLAVRNQIRQDRWETLSRRERRNELHDNRRARLMGATAVAMAVTGIGVAVNSYLSSKGLSTGGNGSASAADMLMNRGHSGNTPDISVGKFDLNVPDRSSRGTIPSPVEFSKAAQHIEAGEGFNQTFREMGIPRDKWAATLRKAGPELVKMGVAYKDQAVGGYGFSQEGPLKRAALQVISKAAGSIK